MGQNEIRKILEAWADEISKRKGIYDFNVVVDMGSIDFYASVCEHCYEICTKRYEDKLGGGRMVWFACPVCNNGDPQLDSDSFLEMGEQSITKEELLVRLSFMKLGKGIDNAPSIP